MIVPNAKIFKTQNILQKIVEIVFTDFLSVEILRTTQEYFIQCLILIAYTRIE